MVLEYWKCIRPVRLQTWVILPREAFAFERGGLWHPLSSVQAPVSSTLSVRGPCSQLNLDINTGKSGALGHEMAKRQLPLIDWIIMQDSPRGSTVLPSNGVGRKTVKGGGKPKRTSFSLQPILAHAARG